MANKLFDLAVKTREYTDTNGNKKAVWLNIGSQWQGQDGSTYIRLNASFNPAGIPRKDGSDSIIVSMFKPKEKQNSDHYDNDIPQSFSDVPF